MQDIPYSYDGGFVDVDGDTTWYSASLSSSLSRLSALSCSLLAPFDPCSLDPSVSYLLFHPLLHDAASCSISFGLPVCPWPAAIDLSKLSLPPYFPLLSAAVKQGPVHAALYVVS